MRPETRDDEDDNMQDDEAPREEKV